MPATLLGGRVESPRPPAFRRRFAVRPGMPIEESCPAGDDPWDAAIERGGENPHRHQRPDSNTTAGSGAARETLLQIHRILESTWEERRYAVGRRGVFTCSTPDRPAPRTTLPAADRPVLMGSADFDSGSLSRPRSLVRCTVPRTAPCPTLATSARSAPTRTTISRPGRVYRPRESRSRAMRIERPIRRRRLRRPPKIGTSGSRRFVGRFGRGRIRAKRSCNSR
jgi:hypothetical protein